MTIFVIDYNGDSVKLENVRIVNTDGASISELCENIEVRFNNIGKKKHLKNLLFVISE
jgi:hypothetical protein